MTHQIDIYAFTLYIYLFTCILAFVALETLHSVSQFPAHQGSKFAADCGFLKRISTVCFSKSYGKLANINIA